MRGLTKNPVPAGILLAVLMLSAAACGPVSRVEPAVGDRPEMVDKITGSWKEAAVLDQARALAASFVRSWRDGEHEAAWGLLAPAWRKRFAGIAGDREPLALFKKGHLPRKEGVVPWDPVVSLFGERLMYLSLPTKEMGVKETPGVLLVYAVQDDGTWSSFRVVTVAEKRYLEPVGVLE